MKDMVNARHRSNKKTFGTYREKQKQVGSFAAAGEKISSNLCQSIHQKNTNLWQEFSCLATNDQMW